MHEAGKKLDHGGQGGTRKVCWVVDTDGRAGKDTLMRYLHQVHGAGFLRYGKSHDALNIVCKIPAPIWVINLPRQAPGDVPVDDLYSTIEQIKDGYMVNGKYEGNMQARKSPAVIVLANFEPPLERLSKDRWFVYRVRGEDRPPADAWSAPNWADELSEVC